MKTTRWLISLVLLGTLCGCSEILREIERNVDPNAAATPSDGLREALRIGTERAVGSLGRTDGYLGSPDLRIGVPEKLDKLARALRAIGAGDEVDEFELSLNRAAESAAPLAKEVFWNAIREMTIDDAMIILRGNAHEATDYLRGRSETLLAGKFRPIVVRQLDSVGATREFNELVNQANSLPFVSKPVFDLPDYVTEEALDGLFHELGKEERRIREDPLARTTELLRRFFGKDGR